MHVIQIQTTSHFTTEMEALRRLGYHGKLAESSDDEFDALSIHFTATVDGELAGMIRRTEEPPSILAKWSRGHCPLPRGKGVVDLTRAIVAEKWRGISLYKLLMTQIGISLGETDTEYAVGAVELAFPLRGFLSDIGYVDIGFPLCYVNPPVDETIGQAIVQMPQESKHVCRVFQSKLVEKLYGKGFLVQGHLCRSIMESRIIR